ncbi:MAG: class I SAM-dependent methyltransferase [Chloroflexia bacterium]|nr:class I SAM-dependent methyltransferase [Chloroflexia bacterium]
MGLKQNLFKQFRKPTGSLGRVIGWLMSIKNKDRASWTIDNLRINPGDKLLEIGYGPGVTLGKAANRLTSGFIAGIDHSEIMLKQATKRNKKHIENNKVKLEQGTIWDLEYPDNHFDTIYGSNVHFFWKDPVEEFTELVKLLKPEGQLLMVFQPRWTTTEDEVKEVAEKTKIQYEKVGLTNIKTDFKKMSPVTCISIIGKKISPIQATNDF